MVFLSFCYADALIILGRWSATKNRNRQGSDSTEEDMSLFHNLKLKRRKVGSRSSSDGKIFFFFLLYIDY